MEELRAGALAGEVSMAGLLPRSGCLGAHARRIPCLSLAKKWHRRSEAPLAAQSLHAREALSHGDMTQGPQSW